jgi:hypothetical protein
MVLRNHSGKRKRAEPLLPHWCALHSIKCQSGTNLSSLLSKAPACRALVGSPASCSRLKAKARTQHRNKLCHLGSAAHALWIAELGDSLTERNRHAIRGAINAPGEDAATSRGSLPLAARAFRLVEGV